MSNLLEWLVAVPTVSRDARGLTLDCRPTTPRADATLPLDLLADVENRVPDSHQDHEDKDDEREHSIGNVVKVHGSWGQKAHSVATVPHAAPSESERA